MKWNNLDISPCVDYSYEVDGDLDGFIVAICPQCVAKYNISKKNITFSECRDEPCKSSACVCNIEGCNNKANLVCFDVPVSEVKFEKEN